VSKVLCLRPEADFSRAGAPAPDALAVDYRAPAEPDVPALIKSADALVIPAVGPPLAPALFESTKLKLVQVTGAGVDRLDREKLVALGLPVANVAGGSNSAVAEYVVTGAALLLRRFAWSTNDIRRGSYAETRARYVSDNVGGLEGLTAGIVGFGTIGVAVARALQAAGCRIVFFDPAPGNPRAAEELQAACPAPCRHAQPDRRGRA
jgi:phosphoglycerate dehydrogenase-like enzyme